MTQNLYILTGGPGSGKSSVIDELSRQGYTCAEEVGRAVIQDQVAIDGEALPWKDAARFRDLMFEAQLELYDSFKSKKIVFFDRGLIDCIGYSRLVDIEVPATMKQLAMEHPFNPTVFTFPPWEEIYANDEERKQDFDEAVATYEAMVEVYREYGYTTLDVPKLPVKDRVAFILDSIELESPGNEGEKGTGEEVSPD